MQSALLYALPGGLWQDGQAQSFGATPLVATQRKKGQLMSATYIKLGDTIRFDLGTTDSMAQAVNADSLPVVTVIDQGTAMGYVPTVTNKAAGMYEVALVLTGGNGFTVNHEYSAYVTYTLSGVTKRESIASFRLSPTSIADVKMSAAGNVKSDLEEWLAVVPNALQSGRVDSIVGALAASVITATSIASSAFTSAKFAAGAITSSVMAAGSITAAVIATDAIDADALATDAITEIVAAIFAFAVESGVTFQQAVRAALATTGKMVDETLTAYTNPIVMYAPDGVTARITATIISGVRNVVRSL